MYIEKLQADVLNEMTKSCGAPVKKANYTIGVLRKRRNDYSENVLFSNFTRDQNLLII